MYPKFAVNCLVLGVLVWDCFACNVSLHGKGKAWPSFFLFILNLQNSMKLHWRISFSFSAWRSMVKQVHALLQMGVFWRSSGRYRKNVSGGKHSDPHFQHNSDFPTWNLIDRQRSATCMGFQLWIRLVHLHWSATCMGFQLWIRLVRLHWSFCCLRAYICQKGQAMVREFDG